MCLNVACGNIHVRAIPLVEVNVTVTAMLRQRNAAKEYFILTRIFEIISRILEILTRIFEIVTRIFEIISRIFEILTRIFDVISRIFEILTRIFEMISHLIGMVTRIFEIISRVDTGKAGNPGKETNEFQAYILHFQRCLFCSL